MSKRKGAGAGAGAAANGTANGAAAVAPAPVTAAEAKAKAAADAVAELAAEAAAGAAAAAAAAESEAPVIDAQEIAARLVLDTKARGPGVTDALATDVFEDSQDVNLNPDVYAVRDDTAPEPNTALKAVAVALSLVVASAVYKGEPLPLVGTHPTQAVRWLWAQGAALSTSTWLLLTLAPVVAYAYYVIFWRPLVYTRKLVHKPVKRSVASLPPPYPNGWFKVADSHELPPGALKSLKVLGQELVLFRGYGATAYHSDGTAVTNSRHTLDHKDSAKDKRGAGPAEGTPQLADLPQQQAVHVLDAFCPHLGANLAVGGKVTGDCVECPFHGWLFRGSDGKCTHIPYSNGAIPAAAKTRSWPTREVNGCVYLWHDLDGRPPSWEPLPLDNSGERTTSPGSGESARHPGPAPRTASVCERLFGCRAGLRFHGRTRHYVGGHIQEIPENGVDTAHFHHLHTPLLSFVKFKWNAVWAPSRAADESHITNMQIDTQLTVFGWTLPFVKFSCFIKQIGPALVHLNFRYPFGRLMCVESVTPMAPLLQRCEHTMFADWWVPRVIPKTVLKILSLQFERDVPIWSNKQLLAKPTLVKEDGRVVQFRQWYRQFYQSANGNKRREALDW